ncbi:MAG: chemotaxis protein CheW [Candidatus Riflebacteria bacterium]
MDKQIQAFFEEAFELLHELEQLLLDLENSPGNSEVAAGILRILHTLKGTSAMFAFNEISDFVHKIEAIFIHFRDSQKNIDKSLIDVFIAAADTIRRALHEEPHRLAGQNQVIVDKINQTFENTLKPKEHQPSEKTMDKPGTKRKAEKKSHEKTWLIEFTPCPEFFSSGNTPDRILAELSELGKLKVECDVTKVPEFSRLDPEKCYLSWNLTLSTGAPLNEIKDVFIFVEDLAKIQFIEKSVEMTRGPGNSVEEKAEVKAEIIDQNNSVEFQPREIKDKVEKLLSSLPRDKSYAENFSNAEEDSGFGFLQANTEKMIALLGDLVTVQSKLNQKASIHGDPEMISISNELDNITDELRDCAMHLSMFPIGSVFADLRNAVVHAGKGKVSIELQGASTEIDRSAFMIVKTAYVAMFFSLAAFAAARKKSVPDKISFFASHQVGKAQLELRFSSDHESISLLEAMKNSDPEPDAAIYSVFATIKALETKLLVLHGSLAFEKLNEENFLVRVSIPLNLAIIESLMVQVGKGFFLLPLADIEECIELSEEDQKKSYRKNVAIVRGLFVPYLHIREKFSISGNVPPVQQIVIMKLEQQRIGLVVDQVVGEYQTAIKNWGNFCKDVCGISGAAILGDGGIALLIDFRALVDEEKELLENALKEISHGI